MRVPTIYAHHNPRSLCHAVLERFTEGLRDAGHTNEVVDLHAFRFDPVVHDRDGPDWIDDSVPGDVLEHTHVKRSLLERARNPLRRLLVKRWIGDRNDREVGLAECNATFRATARDRYRWPQRRVGAGSGGTT